MSIELEVIRLAATMRSVHELLERLESAHRPVLGNALLNLAVCRMIETDGAMRTAAVLARLADAVLRGPIPHAQSAVDLSSLNA